MVGGAVVEGASWQWIFWLNVPIGLALMPLAARRLHESQGPNATLDLGGVALLSGGLLGVVWGIVRGHGAGWTSLEVTGALGAGVALSAAFLAWERRTRAPMLPLRFFRDRALAAANLASLAMYFGLFGVVFLLAQFLQIVQGYSPFEAGLRTLPWTAMPVLVAPLAGMLSDRIGGRPLMAAGLLLQALALGWIAVVTTPGVGYGELVPPFVLAGVGMSLFFAPVAGVVLSAVRPIEEGQASGVNTAVRELGGVLGVAVLATVFASAGGYETPAGFVDGLVAAAWIGAAAVGIGGLAALAIPAAGRREAGTVARPATAIS